MPHRPVGSIWIAGPRVRSVYIRPGHRLEVVRNEGLSQNIVRNLSADGRVLPNGYELRDDLYTREVPRNGDPAPQAAEPEERFFILYRIPPRPESRDYVAFSCLNQRHGANNTNAFTRDQIENIRRVGSLRGYEWYVIPARATEHYDRDGVLDRAFANNA